TPHRRLVAGQAEQVVTLGPRQVQTLGDRGDHLLGRLRAALTLQPRVVVGRHVAQRCDLLASQAARAAATTPREAHVLRLQHLAAGAEERGEPTSIDHAGILPGAGVTQPRIVRPWIPWPVSERLEGKHRSRCTERSSQENRCHVATTSRYPTCPAAGRWSPAP